MMISRQDRGPGGHWSFTKQAVLTFVVLSITVPAGVRGSRTSAARTRVAAADTAISSSINTDQKIAHVLNRLGYGPRPGDIERVTQMGIDKYIDQQLHPERIDDSALEAKLRQFATLTMSTSELIRSYPPPQVQRRLLQQTGATPGAPPARPQELSPEVRQKLREEMSRQQAQAADPARRDPQSRVSVETMLARNANRPARVLQELQAQKLIRAVDSNRQLEEVMVDFWVNHFNVFAGKGPDRWMLTQYERDVIRPHAFGKFQDLLEATAKSPAMLFYLDNWQSTASSEEIAKSMRGTQGAARLGRLGRVLRPGRGRNRPPRIGSGRQQPQMPGGRPGGNANARLPKRAAGLNENYARELMELHTLGDDGGYTQKDVTEVARCFTGWTIRQPRQDGDFIFREAVHGRGEKVVLGHRIHEGGMKDGEKVIELLASHPATAHFIAKKLCRRFVADEPPHGLVDRVASVFLNTGGDIREVVRSIVTSKEFFSADSYRAKVKTPLELVASSIRAVGGDTDGSPRVHQYLQRLGMPLYGCQPPTGYADKAEAWVSAGALLDRLNFEVALSANRIAGTQVDLSQIIARGSGQGASGIAGRLAALLLQSNLSASTRLTIEREFEKPEMDAASLSDPQASNQAARIAALLLGSPEFQRR